VADIVHPSRVCGDALIVLSVETKALKVDDFNVASTNISLLHIAPAKLFPTYIYKVLFID
jgi:hypothetical protein